MGVHSAGGRDLDFLLPGRNCRCPKATIAQHWLFPEVRLRVCWQNLRLGSQTQVHRLPKWSFLEKGAPPLEVTRQGPRFFPAATSTGLENRQPRLGSPGSQRVTAWGGRYVASIEFGERILAALGDLRAGSQLAGATSGAARTGGLALALGETSPFQP